MWRRNRAAHGTQNLLVLSTAPLVIVGPALLVAFNTWASGSPLGFRHASELTTSFARGAEIFLGLHLDQSQGTFVQQPLFRPVSPRCRSSRRDTAGSRCCGASSICR